MSEENTFEKVKSIVVEQLGVDEKEVKMDAAYILGHRRTDHGFRRRIQYRNP